MELKKYEAQVDITELGISKGDQFFETEDSYTFFHYNEEVENNCVRTCSSYKYFPKTLIENNTTFLLMNKEVTTENEIEKEVPVETVKKELQDDVVDEPLIQRVKVILSFPGGKEGEIFEYSSMTGNFISLTPVDEDEYLTTILANGRRTLTVEEVMSNIDYFEDITPKVMKTKEEVMMKIADLAEQKLGLEKAMEDMTNKLQINSAKRQLKLTSMAIKALEWSIGEGKDFIVE